MVPGLTGFTKTFFAKHTLLAILTRYCVFTADRMLLVMRPYQIVATELPTTAAFEIARRRDQLVLVFNTRHPLYRDLYGLSDAPDRIR